MTMRVRDIDAFCGAYKRAQRRSFHVLLNFGDGRVAFVREKDLGRDPIWLVNQVKNRPDLRLFQVRDILSEKADPSMVEYLASNDWKIARVDDSFILENVLPVLSKPFILDAEQTFDITKPRRE